MALSLHFGGRIVLLKLLRAFLNGSLAKGFSLLKLHSRGKGIRRRHCHLDFVALRLLNGTPRRDICLALLLLLSSLLLICNFILVEALQLVFNNIWSSTYVAAILHYLILLWLLFGLALTSSEFNTALARIVHRGSLQQNGSILVLVVCVSFHLLLRVHFGPNLWYWLWRWDQVGKDCGFLGAHFFGLLLLRLLNFVIIRG